MSRGSVFLHKDGRWEAQLSLGRDDNGKRVSKSFYGSTRGEAERKMLSAEYFIRTPVLTGMTV